MSDYSEAFLKVMNDCKIPLSREDYAGIRAKDNAALEFNTVLNNTDFGSSVEKLRGYRNIVDAFGYDLTKSDETNLFCVLTSAHLLGLIRAKPLAEQFPERKDDVLKLKAIAEDLKARDSNIRTSGKTISLGNRTFGVTDVLENNRVLYTTHIPPDKHFDDYAILQELVSDPSLVAKAADFQKKGYKSFQNEFGVNLPVEKVHKIRYENSYLFK